MHEKIINKVSQHFGYDNILIHYLLGVLLLLSMVGLEVRKTIYSNNPLLNNLPIQQLKSDNYCEQNHDQPTI